MTASPSSTKAGQIIILNGAPRSGKSSIAAVIQNSFGGVWINFGVDAYGAMVPKMLWPGIGLRPGGERPDIEAQLPVLFAALYESIAAHSRLGLNVVVDIGHGNAHDPAILRDCARRLDGLPALFVGVVCDIDVIMARRAAGQAGREGQYAVGTPDDPYPAPVVRWQEHVRMPGAYDLEVDTSAQSPEACASAIRAHLNAGVRKPSAFQRLANA